MRCAGIVFLLFPMIAMSAWRAQAADLIGNCEMSGTKGDMAISAPVVPGQLTVAVSLPAPTWWNGESADAVRDGFEYCLAANIAWHAGFDKLAVVDMAWNKLIDGSGHGFDLAVSEISVTAERKAKLSFTAPYFTTDFGVLVKPGTAIDGATLPEARIGVLEATAGANFARETLKAKSVKGYPEQGELFSALRAGQIDAVVTDLPIAISEQGLEGGSVVTIGRYHSGQAFAGVFPKGSADGPVFGRIIAKLMDDGTDKWLAKKYLWSVWNIDPEAIPYFGP